MFKKLFALSLATSLKVIIPSAYAAGMAADAYSSTRFRYYGGLEGMSWFKDQYGDFSLWRYVLICGAFLVVGIGINWWMDSYIPSAVLLALGAGTRFLISIFKNMKNASNNREKQWNDFRFLRQHGRLPVSPSTITIGKRYRYRLSQWIYVDNVNTKDAAQVEAARAEILSKLSAAVAQDESIWFTKHWYETDWRVEHSWS